MRNSIFAIVSILGLISFSSCEKVIDIDLKESDNKLVIEGKLNNDGECTVKLTQVKNYDQDNEFPGVDDAIVVIFDDLGNLDTLEQGIAGMFYSEEIIGTPGVTYSLNVFWNNNNYTSVCKMPELVAIDSLSLRKEVFFFDTTTIAIVHFNDPGSENNYYRYLYTINATLNKDYNVESDRFYNGLTVETRIPIFNGGPNSGPGGGGPGGPGNIGPGPINPDTLRLEMWGIDQSMELYYRTLSASIDAGSGQQAAPANPESNITGGALGYFSAYSISKASILIE